MFWGARGDDDSAARGRASSSVGEAYPRDRGSISRARRMPARVGRRCNCAARGYDRGADELKPWRPRAGPGMAWMFRNAGDSEGQLLLRLSRGRARCGGVLIRAQSGDPREQLHLGDSNGLLPRLRSSQPARHANVAIAIARRPFLSGEEAPWIEGWRAKLTATLVRAIRELITITAANREPAVAIQHAEEILEVGPDDGTVRSERVDSWAPAPLRMRCRQPARRPNDPARVAPPLRRVSARPSTTVSVEDVCRLSPFFWHRGCSIDIQLRSVAVLEGRQTTHPPDGGRYLAPDRHVRTVRNPKGTGDSQRLCSAIPRSPRLTPSATHYFGQPVCGSAGVKRSAFW